MAKGDILKAALINPNRGPHKTAVIRSAIYKEMEQYTAQGSLPFSLNASDICEFLAPNDGHLTLDDEVHLREFAEYLAVVDTNPNARPGYRFLGNKFSEDIGV